MVKNFYVYKHIAPSGKVYIGITSQTPSRRWNNGDGYKTQPLFYRAIQKYGWGNIRHEILFDSLTKEQAEQKEIELIAEYKSNQKEYGYNLASGGGGILGYKYTDEQRQKVSEAHRGIAFSEERKRRISEAQKGKVIPSEMRERISRTLKGNKCALGHKLSQEAKDKISLANKGKAAWNKGVAMSEEQKRKVSENRKGKNAGKDNKKSKTVYQFSLDGELITKWDCAADAGRALGVDYKSICACCTKRQHTAYGFIWTYEYKNF